MAVLKELWTGELIKKFRYEGLFLSRIKSDDDKVNNNVIHMAQIGADPAVLVNNTAYPIAIAQRTDEDVAISLDKFDTANTAVTRDELHGLPYDKGVSVIEQHKEALTEKTADKAVHSICPFEQVAGKTRLIATTGASNGATNPRKRLSPAEIIAAKRFMDDMSIPRKDRILVLCASHIEDLLLVDEKFANQYKNMKTGEVLAMYGFDIYEYSNIPKYAVASGSIKKKAWAAAANDATDQDASFFFYAPRVFMAKGTAEMFYQDATTNPTYRQSVVGFQMYHVCIPKVTDGFGAIVSTIVT